MTFTAAFSDPDSAITGYDWDLDGNGTVDRTTTANVTQFTYGAQGVYNPTVAAKDFRGGSTSADTSVTVGPPESGPPGPPGQPPTPGPRPSLTVPTRGSNGAIRPRVKCASRCTLTATFRMTKATARKLGLKKRTQTFRRTITSTKSRRLTLRLSSKIRRAARRAGVKSLRGRLKVTVRQTGGRARTVTKTVRIRV